MLNIGRLAPGAADYYLAEVATSAEDYYCGHGEADGRWVGSLAPELGIEGRVEPEHFRAVLDGRHPRTGLRLVRARSGGPQPLRPPDPNQSSLFDGDQLDVGRVAARLRLSARSVRRLLHRGAQAQRDPTVDRRKPMLFGMRATQPGRLGAPPWHVSRGEVERFEAAYRTRKARPGYDVTLRPPKSVSVLWALAPEAQRHLIRDAHREAVDAVVAYIEAHALHARRGLNGSFGRVDVDGLVAAAFDHRTSRAGDPLLHTHVVVTNLTRTVEGNWRAIDARELYEHARSAGFLYQAHLRQVLARTLGVRWGDVRNGWAEIDGVPGDVIRAFSKRRDEIEEVIAESGYTSARAHEAATLATRKAKQYGVNPQALAQAWRDEAAALGFGPDEVAACFGRDSASVTSLAPVEPMDAEALFDWLGGPDGLTRHSSTFARHDVVAAIAERLADDADAATIDTLAGQFLGSGRAQPLYPDDPAARVAELVWRRDGSRDRNIDAVRWSTPELLQLEQQLVDWADHDFGTPPPAPPQHTVDAALDRRPELSAEQLAMVRALAAPDAPAIQPVAGRPGSGKTFAAAAYVEALTGAGIPVTGCALSATAAAELEAATALGPLTGRPATTIARFLLDADRSPLPAGTVVLVDEASMVGTRDLARIASHVQRAGGMLKLIGDPDQHGSIETGGMFRTLAARQGDRLVELVGNNRQTDPGDRTAIERYRGGFVDNALARYDAAGKIVRSPTAAASFDAIVTDWWTAASAGGTDPMIAGPNAVRAALNRRARAHMKAHGLLDDPSVDAAGRELAVGDWIVTRRNDRRLTSATGAHVKNGSAGVVVAINVARRSVVVEFAKEGRITLPPSYLDAGHVDYGYARTTYGVQGATLERALYHVGDRSGFEEGYVALTRARTETRIYMVDGGAATDDDAHPGHSPDHTGYDTIVEALNRRRAETPAIETSALAPRTLAYRNMPPEDFASRRELLEAIRNAAPRDVTGIARQIGWRRDGLLARRRTALACRDERDGRLPTLDRELGRAAAQLDRLRGQLDDRSTYLRGHAAELQELDVVQQVEASGPPVSRPNTSDQRAIGIVP